MFSQAVGFLFRILGKPEQPKIHHLPKQVQEPYPTFFCNTQFKNFVAEVINKENTNGRQ